MGLAPIIFPSCYPFIQDKTSAREILRNLSVSGRFAFFMISVAFSQPGRSKVTRNADSRAACTVWEWVMVIKMALRSLGLPSMADTKSIGGLCFASSAFILFIQPFHLHCGNSRSGVYRPEGGVVVVGSQTGIELSKWKNVILFIRFSFWLVNWRISTSTSLRILALPAAFNFTLETADIFCGDLANMMPEMWFCFTNLHEWTMFKWILPLAPEYFTFSFVTSTAASSSIWLSVSSAVPQWCQKFQKYLERHVLSCH